MKHLVLFVLVVSFLALVSGVAPAADGWTLVSKSLPSVLTWNEGVGASVAVTNSSDTAWDSTYALTSVVTSPVEALSQRWGLGSVPVVGTVAPAAGYAFNFAVFAPPVTSLLYPAGATPTSVASMVGFSNLWTMAKEGVTFGTAVGDPTVVERFSDIGPDETVAAKKAFAFQIEEMAGHVPFITAGFSDGTYRATATLTRAQLSAFLQRALKLPLPAVFTLTFTDMTAATPFWQEIQAIVGEGIVGGYQIDNTFRPTNPVTRGQMAQFLAKSVLGGAAIPSGPATPTFSDVPTSYTFYDAIEYGVAHDMFSGYQIDNTYRPTTLVSRGQMASFMYRSFIGPSPCVVVLGGPAVTKVEDPAASSYTGWPTVSIVSAADPGYAYVVLDAMRLGPELVGPDSTLDVTFHLAPAVGATTSATVSLSASDITAARDAAALSGDPYLVLSWGIPGGLAEGDYTLSADVTDENDQTFAVKETQELTLGPKTIVAAWGRDEIYAHEGGGAVTDAVLASGGAEELEATDGSYLVGHRSSAPTDCGPWVGAIGLAFHGVPQDASLLDMTVTYHVEGTTGSCCDLTDTYLGEWDLPTPHEPVTSYEPWGWGARVASGTNEHLWFDVVGPNGSETLVGSGDPNLPGVTDLQAGNEYGRTGFLGHPTTDSTYTWKTHNPADCVEPNGDVYVLICGGGFTDVYFDQCTLTITP